MSEIIDNEKDKLLRKKSNIDHVLYEFEMYLRTYDRLNNNRTKDQFQINLLIESHQIHSRILIEFFTENVFDGVNCKNSNLQKIVISDILSEDAIKRIHDGIGNDKKTLKKIRPIINQSIAHMDKTRYSDFAKKIEEEDITEATKKYIPQAYQVLVERISKFLNELTDEIIEQNLSQGYSKEERKRIFQFFKDNRDSIKDYLGKSKKLSTSENATVTSTTLTPDNNFETSSFAWQNQLSEVNSCLGNVGIATSGDCNMFSNGGKYFPS